MMLKKILTCFLIGIFLFSGCYSPAKEYRRSPAPPKKRKPPELYDKFGFPVGGIYPLVDKNGFVVKGFKPNLVALTGFNCASRKSKRITYYMNREALIYFEKMQAAARKKGIYLSICSAYRDYNYQKKLKRQLPTKAIHAGYSEHHLGTTVDLVNVNWHDRRFKWLKKNAHLYGFILTYYRRPALGVGEANHWRYVGKEAAQAFYNRYGKKY